MNQRQNQHFRMFLNTQETLDQNTDLWNSIPVMVQVKNKLDELVQRIQELDSKTNPSSASVTEQKNRALEKLAMKAAVLSGITRARNALDDNPHPGELEVTKSNILRAREASVETLVQPLIDAIRDNMDAYEDFNVNEDMLNETETTLDDFKTLVGKPRNIRNKAYAATGSLDELFDNANNLLNNSLDALMKRFEISNPTFYDEYSRARTIVD
ncbi:MAG: hypothetical protein R6U46_04850 [Marinilabilia sp.]